MIIDRKTGVIYFFKSDEKARQEMSASCRIANFAGGVLSEWGRCFATASLMAYGVCLVTSLVSKNDMFLAVPNFQTIFSFSFGALVGYLGWGIKKGIEQQ